MIKPIFNQCLPNSWILSPKFAYQLIGCLSAAFVVGVMGAVAMYFYATVMSEVSDYRKNFNNGYTQSRDFFEKNEMLLAGMIRSIDFLPASVTLAGGPESTIFYFTTRSAPEGRTGALRLSAQMRQDLRESNTNIIYMDRATGDARYAFKSDGFKSHNLKEVYEHLQGIDTPNVAGELQVFQLGTGSEKKSYIFEQISPRLVPDAWLGVEVPHEHVQQSITAQIDMAPELGVKYCILDKNGQVVSGMPEPESGVLRNENFLNALNSKGDGFESFGAPVFKLFLKKELGGGQRWIIYYASYSDVLWQIRYSVFFGLLICIAAIASAFIIMRYVRLAVFLPAQEQTAQLLEREEFNRTMLQFAPVGICVFSRKTGELLIQSEKARLMLSSYVEMGGSRKSLGDYFMGIQFVAGKAPYRTSVTIFTNTNDGDTSRYIHISLAELQYNDQPVLFCSFIDDSERRRAELMLAAAKTAADEANAAKSTFLAMMSHEIRTPLYGVLGTLELLANTALSPQQRGYLSTIEHSSNNLLHIIDDILDFSKVEANKLALESGPFNPVELVQDVARGFLSQARKKGVDVFCFLQPDVPLLVGDRNRLQQVLSNLLSNAVKFTDSGKIVVRLSGAENAAGSIDVRIQVSDSGIGICKASQARLFEPFIQADDSTARRFGGTGLGLSICRKLMELMGGTIGLVSEVGLGSSFTLKLVLPIAGKPQSVSLAGLPTIQVLAGANEQCETLLALVKHAGGRAQSLMQGLPASADTDVLLVGWSHRPDMALLNSFAGVVWLDPQGTSVPQWCEDGWHVNSLCQQGILQALQLAAGREAAMPVVSTAAAPAKIKRWHVLAVEDHPVNQMVMSEQLQQLGYQVTMTSDGREALQRVQRGEIFDVVLTDVNMPELDGYQLTRRLRREGLNVPIVGVTANVQADEVERCLKAGMDGHLAKPVSLSSLKQELVRIGR